MFFREEFDKYIINRKRSHDLWKRSKILPGGVSHNIRNLGLPLIGAFPVFIQSGTGTSLIDVDNNNYIDFWMGHFALLLGHKNNDIKEVLEQKINNGWGIGTVNEDQVILAETLINDNPSLEKIRFCTSGTEATMYATRLARAFTGKRLILKAKMGWHGPNDTLFYDVKAPFKGKESPGILNEDQAGIITFDINNYDIKELIKNNKDKLAAAIIEPIIGGGGGFPVDFEFLKILREETEKYGILLIFDEVITGYRFSYGLFQNELNIKPDLTTMGKIIGGGMPIGAIGGKDEILEQANPLIKNKVWIGGGTFSGNHLSMVAGIKMLELLKKREFDYQRINNAGEKLRTDLETFFKEKKLNFVASGYKSIVFLHALSKLVDNPSYDDIVNNTSKKKEAWLTLTLLNRSIIGMHGLGALSLIHTKENIDYVLKAIQRVVEPISKKNID